ncbi:MAG: F-box protein [Bdellovibrionia bacterium]
MHSLNFKALIFSILILNSFSFSALAEGTSRESDATLSQTSDLPSPLSALPSEIFLEISKWLNLDDQRNLSSTNRNFRDIIVYEHFGKKVIVIGKTLTEEDFQIFSGPNSFFSASREVNLSRSTFPAAALAYLSPKLESLNLSQSQIIGDPAEFIGRFTHLKTLILNEMRIDTPLNNDGGDRYARFRPKVCSTLPNSILRLLPPSLQILDLSGNKIASANDLSLINQEHLPNLKYLGLSDIGRNGWGTISFQITSEFFLNLPETLEHLNLADSEVGSLVPLTSENFPNLKFLDISGMGDLEQGIIPNLPLTLEWLDLTGSRLAEPRELLLLSRFQQLRGLSLNYTRDLNGPVIDEVLKLTQLEILDISNQSNVITQEQITQFLALPSLTRMIRFPYGQRVSGLHLFAPTNPLHWTNLAREKDSQEKRDRTRIMGMFLN